MSFAFALAEDRIWPGEMCAVAVAGHEVLLVRVDEGLFAYEDRCPHLGVPLSRGELENNELTCSAHRYVFDARSGRGINPRSACLKPLPLRIDEGMIWVDVPEATP